MKSLALVLAFLAWFAAPANADFDAGMAAYQRGDYATALRELKPLAEQGNAEAPPLVGVQNDNGHGLPQDYVLAYIFVAAQKESRVIPDSYQENLPSKFNKVKVRKPSHPSRLVKPNMGSTRKTLPAGWILVAGEWKPKR